jgi:predicted Zn-dependent protease
VGLRQNLEAMLEAGQDNALLRLTLGSECLKSGEAAEAATHLRRAVVLDPDYSAAWKALGRALQASDDLAGAVDAWTRGRAAAQRGGDVQAAKEIGVFLRRLEQRLAADDRKER